MRLCALTRWWFTINLIHIHRTFNKYLLVHTQIYNSSKHQSDEIFPSAPDMMSSWSGSLMFISEGLALVHRGVKLILRLIFSSSDSSISHCIIMILKAQILSINVWTSAIIIIIRAFIYLRVKLMCWYLLTLSDFTGFVLKEVTSE